MQLNENLDYHDLAGQVISTLSVDEYSAKAGTDDEIVTLAFIVRGTQASQDITDWFERGYDWVLDAQVSEGEYVPGKNLVFVEMPRRTKSAERIIELLQDLETLTDIKLTEWTISVDGEEYDADVEVLKSVIISSPHDYREAHPEGEEEAELNEMREIAGIPHKDVYKEHDQTLKNFLAKAGL
jgi:hypothetical protein